MQATPQKVKSTLTKKKKKQVKMAFNKKITYVLKKKK